MRIKKTSRVKHLIKKGFLLFIFSLCLLFGYALISRTFFGRHSFVSPTPEVFSKFSIKNQDTQLQEIKTLEALLRKNNIQFSSISFSQGFFVIKLSLGEEVFIAPSKNLELQISSLQLILSRLTIEGKKFSRLDFRFDKPVVSFK